MARLLAVSYNGVTIGLSGGASYHLQDKYTWEEGYDQARIVFRVLVTNATRATFLAAELALRAAFSAPDGDLSVTLGGSSRHVYTQAGNAGFNARSSCRKLGGDTDTANSSEWECEVVIQLPADLTGKDGRREATEEVSYSPANFRTLTVTGVYTALGAAGAKAQYEAEVGDYASGVLSALTGTWRSVGSGTWSREHNDKLLRFTRLYEEVTIAPPSGVTSLVSPTLKITKRTAANESSPELGATAALVELTLEYGAWVDKDSTVDLEALYEGSLRNYLLAKAQEIANSTVVLTAEVPSYSATGNRIEVVMQLLADGGSDLFQVRYEVSDELVLGKVLTPVWNGRKYARDKYDVPGTHRKTVLVTLVAKRGAGEFAPPAFAGFEELAEARRERAFNFAIPGQSLPAKAVVREFVYERADVELAIAGGGGGGGGADETSAARAIFGVPPGGWASVLAPLGS
jgi:hypothetical protein